MTYSRFWYLVQCCTYKGIADLWRRFIINVPFYFKWGVEYRKAWCAGSYLTNYNLRMLRAFRNCGLHSFPMDFCEREDFPEDSFYDEEYAKLKSRGGGFEGWLAVIDKIILAFEIDRYENNFEMSRSEKQEFEPKLWSLSIPTVVRTKHIRITDGKDIVTAKEQMADFGDSCELRADGTYEYWPKSKMIEVLSDGSEMEMMEYDRTYGTKIRDLKSEGLKLYAEFYDHFID